MYQKVIHKSKGYLEKEIQDGSDVRYSFKQYRIRYCIITNILFSLYFAYA